MSVIYNPRFIRTEAGLFADNIFLQFVPPAKIRYLKDLKPKEIMEICIKHNLRVKGQKK